MLRQIALLQLNLKKKLSRKLQSLNYVWTTDILAPDLVGDHIEELVKHFFQNDGLITWKPSHKIFDDWILKSGSCDYFPVNSCISSFASPHWSLASLHRELLPRSLLPAPSPRMQEAISRIRGQMGVQRRGQEQEVMTRVRSHLGSLRRGKEQEAVNTIRSLLGTLKGGKESRPETRAGSRPTRQDWGICNWNLLRPC